MSPRLRVVLGGAANGRPNPGRMLAAESWPCGLCGHFGVSAAMWDGPTAHVLCAECVRTFREAGVPLVPLRGGVSIE